MGPLIKLQCYSHDALPVIRTEQSTTFTSSRFANFSASFLKCVNLALICERKLVICAEFRYTEKS